MKPLFLILTAFICLSVSTSLAQNQIVVNKANNPPVIDGVLEENLWNLNQGLPTNNNSDNSAVFGLLWDNSYLYVGVAVTDNIVLNDRRQAHYSDGVEVLIDGLNESSSYFDNNDFQMIKPVKSYWFQEMNMNFNGVIHKYKDTANGYTMEFAIPWSNLNITPTNGHIAGFNIVVNDDDNPNDQFNSPSQLIWQGPSNYHESTATWGEILLSSNTVDYNSAYIGLTTPNDGEYLSIGKMTSINWRSFGVSQINIEYSTNGGNQWTPIATNINASTGYYNWNVNAPASENVLFRISDVSNPNVFDVSDMPNIVSPALITSENLIPSLWENYKWPYNAYYPPSSNGINGHIGNACGPSTIARTLHSWEFPRRGSGSLNTTDYYGTNWVADFGNTIYNYDNMPNSLSYNATQAEYTDVATLMYHAAVAGDDYYGSGRDLQNMRFLMSTYFNYKNSQIAYMHDYTRAEWTKLLKNEIDNGRPLIIIGMNLNYFGDWHTSNNVGGHWYHVDGYNNNGEFHVVVGFGNFQYDGYYGIEEFPMYGYNVGTLIGLEPDKQGKTLSLTSPNGGEVFISGNQTTITWQSAGVNTIQIEYTLNDGLTWNEIVSATDANTGSYVWTLPNQLSDECKVRLTDTSNINIYDKSDDYFSITTNQLNLTYPKGGESLVFGNKALIAWEISPVNTIDIEYSVDNGNTWSLIEANVNTNLLEYLWDVPATASNNALVRIKDSSNPSNTSVSNSTFKILQQNAVGGPYTKDANTIVLLNAENNLINQSDFTSIPQVVTGVISFENSALSDLGKAIRFDYSTSIPFLEIAHNNSLNLQGDWTIELWMKATGFNMGDQYLIWKPGDSNAYFSNYTLQLKGSWNNVLFPFYFSGSERIPAYTQFYPQLNTWYHVAFVRDTSNSSFEVIIRDQQRQILASYPSTDVGNIPLLNNQNLRIAYNFNGYIDELRISNVVRDFSGSTVSTEEFDTDNQIVIYPNPTTNYFKLNNTETVEIQVYSQLGRLISSYKTVEPGKAIDVTHLRSGIYIVKILKQGKIQTHKLMVR